MEIQQLRCFVAVAREGSFTRASEVLYRTQPTVTAAIQALERDVGHELFERSRRGATLTEAGQDLLEMAAPLLRRFEELPEALAERRSAEPGGPLRVGVGEAVLLYWLPERVCRFVEQHPSVDLTLKREDRDDTVEGLRLGRLDLALRTHRAKDGDAEPLPGLEFSLLFESERVVIGPRGARLPRHLTVDALLEHRYLVHRPGSSTRTVLEGLFNAHGRELPISLESTGWATLVRYAESGLGLAVVPEIVLAGLDTERFVVRRAGELLGWEVYGWLRPAGRPSRAGDAFVDSVSGPLE